MTRTRAGLLLLLGTLLYAGSPFVSRELDLCDEGIVLTNAHLVAQGLWPNRDFWTYYPPGQYVLLAGLFRWVGPSMAVGRLVFMTTLVGIILASFAVLSQWTRRRGLALAGAGVVLCWYGALWPAPLAVHTAVLLVLLTLSCQLAAVARQRAWLMAVAGMTTAVTVFVRHDYGGELLLATVLLLAAGRALRRLAPGAVTLPLRAGRAYLAGGLLVAAPLAAWWLQGVSWRVLVNDLGVYVFQRHLGTLRVGPPAPWPPVSSLWTGAVSWPTWGLELYTRLALWYLPWAALAGAAAWLVRQCRRGAWGRWEQQGLGLLLVALALQPVGWLRSDWTHRIYVVAPPLLVLVGFFGAVLPRLRPTAARAARLAALAVLALAPVPRLLHPPWRGPTHPMTLERARGIAIRDVAGAQALEAAVRAIRRATAPGEPIYAATRCQGRIFAAGEVGLYFLSDRPAGTRYAESWMTLLHDPAVQQTIIRDLDTRRVTLLVFKAMTPAELYHINGLLTADQLAAEPVAPLLDDYVRRHFAPLETIGPFELYRRIGAPRPAGSGAEPVREDQRARRLSARRWHGTLKL